MRSLFDTAYPATSTRGSLFRPASDSKQVASLAAGVQKAVTVPNGAIYVDFGYQQAGGDVWVEFGTADTVISVPGADVTDGSAPELNPGPRKIPDGATRVHLISATAQIVGLSFLGG